MSSRSTQACSWSYVEGPLDRLIAGGDIEDAPPGTRLVKRAGEESGQVVSRDLAAERRGVDVYSTGPGFVG